MTDSIRGSFMVAAIKGADAAVITAIVRPRSTFSVQTVSNCDRFGVFACTSARSNEKALSKSKRPAVAPAIATMPKSSGARRRTKTSVLTNPIDRTVMRARTIQAALEATR